MGDNDCVWWLITYGDWNLETGGSGDHMQVEGVRVGTREGASFRKLPATDDAEMITGALQGCHLIVLFKTKHAT